MMHEIGKHSEGFQCKKCPQTFALPAQKMKHQQLCTGGSNASVSPLVAEGAHVIEGGSTLSPT